MPRFSCDSFAANLPPFSATRKQRVRVTLIWEGFAGHKPRGHSWEEVNSLSSCGFSYLLLELRGQSGIRGEFLIVVRRTNSLTKIRGEGKGSHGEEMKANSVTTKPNPPVTLLPIALLNILCTCFLFEANFYLMSQRCAAWREHESFKCLISDEGGYSLPLPAVSQLTSGCASFPMHFWGIRMPLRLWNESKAI